MTVLLWTMGICFVVIFLMAELMMGFSKYMGNPDRIHHEKILLVAFCGSIILGLIGLGLASL